MNPLTDEDSELRLAQFRSFAAKMPVFYLCAALTMAVQIMVFRDRAPWPIAILVPALVVALALIRGPRWYARQHEQMGIEAVRSLMDNTARELVFFAGIVALMCTYIFVQTSDYSRYFALFTMFSLGVGLYICVLHMRRVAVTVIMLTLVPCGMLLVMTQDLVGYSSAILSFAVSIALLVAAQGYYDDLTSLIKSKLHVAELGRENARLAVLDMLTGLPNRRYFFDVLTREADSARSGHQPLAVGIVDLDGFKPVNDTYGHRVGDMVLAQVARRFSQADSRAVEFCRIGGDEFTFIVRYVTSDEMLHDVGRKIIESVSAPIFVGELRTSVGCSVGFAVMSDFDEATEQLFEKADYALYHAKRNGRARTVIFSSEHREHLAAQGAIEQALRVADFQKELHPVFQPIVEHHTERVIAFEALARWRSPVLGDISPSQFIPVAEQAGLITPITLSLLEQSLIQMATWPKEIGLSFNLSSHDISSPSAVMKALAVVGRSGIDPRRISFEITETALINDFDLVVKHVEIIKAAGIKIALDDFGTGYSSLGHLHKLPLDKLKVDASFVKKLESNSNSRNIVRSVIALCQDLQMDCVVEGVETEGQLSTLAELGCRNIQGYYYSKPLAASDVADFLSTSAGTRQVSAM